MCVLLHLPVDNIVKKNINIPLKWRKYCRYMIICDLDAKGFEEYLEYHTLGKRMGVDWYSEVSNLRIFITII